MLSFRENYNIIEKDKLALEMQDTKNNLEIELFIFKIY